MTLKPSYSICSTCRTRRSCIAGDSGGATAGDDSLVARVDVLGAGREFADPARNGQPIGILRSGMLRVDRMGPTGGRNMLGLVFPGEPVGELLPTRATHIHTALVDSRICRFRAEGAVDFIDFPSQLRHRLLSAYSVRLARLQTILWIRATLSVKARVAALFLMAARFTVTSPLPHGGVLLDFVLPRQDAADLLSTTVESFCRALRSLEDDGFVVIRDTHRFELCDLAALERLSALDAYCLDALFPHKCGDGRRRARSAEKAEVQPGMHDHLGRASTRTEAPTGRVH